ncbi:MAG: hypothetical protein IKK16_03280, partial [Bacteroidaceae bacterium]|nr:hypothetical protein [Bacteroidaceae bacterium]
MRTLFIVICVKRENFRVAKIIQFANIGHSLYGDQKYGKGPQNTQISLWAYRLEFKHPTKDEIMEFEC